MKPIVPRLSDCDQCGVVIVEEIVLMALAPVLALALVLVGALATTLWGEGPGAPGSSCASADVSGRVQG